jgi:hypothetical protein
MSNDQIVQERGVLFPDFVFLVDELLLLDTFRCDQINLPALETVIWAIWRRVSARE